MSLVARYEVAYRYRLSAGVYLVDKREVGSLRLLVVHLAEILGCDAEYLVGLCRFSFYLNIISLYNSLVVIVSDPCGEGDERVAFKI